ncbi:MAG: hypothetical protein LBU87_03125, partial [Lactobacillales bacterium]|nr:hypothetical protein [Lactobacillales bacterium]
MLKLKKTNRLPHVIMILILISLALILWVVFKDFSLSPAASFEKGNKYMTEGKSRQAETYLMMAANADDENVSKIAAYYLGELYRKGGNDFPVNGPKAELFLAKAADAGMHRAQYQLALMYDVGDKIVENRDKALYYMNEAAKSGMAEAQYALGVWLERGY